MAEVALAGLSKRFGEVEVLSDISLTVAPGEFVAFVGPSGCGKSTLLRVIAGLEAADDGEIRFSGRRMNEVPAPDRGAAMVFQSYALYPHMTVWENMSFSLRLQGVGRKDRRARASEVAAMLQLTDYLDRKPAALSGGQRQRVAIGRALLRQPQVFLFDEPLSNLDAALRGDMRVELARLHRQLGATMIYVTHDQVEAMTMADRLVVLHRGRVAQIGRPMDLYHRPATRFVAEFIGTPRINMLSGVIAQDSLRLSSGRALSLGERKLSEGLRCDAGLRPEDVEIATTPEPGALPARIELVEELGDTRLVHCRTADGESLVAKTSAATHFSPGLDVWLIYNPARLHLFDGEGQRIQ